MKHVMIRHAVTVQRTATVVASVFAFVLAMAGPASATPITGVELGTPVTWGANSTNELNFTLQTPGRVGQVAPFVLFDSADADSVTLQFNNFAAGLAFFEIRIDGLDTGVNPHPVVPFDTIHTGGVAVFSGNQLLQTFNATGLVEVRLALGAERDWDFNWTAFEVQAVPEPATLSLVGLGLAGFVAMRRRKV